MTNACKMVLSRIPEERRTAVRKRNPLANYKANFPLIKNETRESLKRERPKSSSSGKSTRSASLTTAIANETLTSTSSSATDDTLGMISTPWSTETWRSPPVSVTRSSRSWAIKEVGSFTSVEPITRTTSTCGESPDVKTGSHFTITLLGDVRSVPSGSRYVLPLHRQYSSSSPTHTSWTLETYTSTGLASSFNNGLQVNYPWSPSTFVSDTEVTDFYPSSLTLISQKCSREGFGKCEARKPLTPMNVLFTTDEHPLLDWILVKQKGIPSSKV